MNYLKRKVSNYHIKTFPNYESWQKNLNEFNISIFILPEWIECFRDNKITPVYFDFLNRNLAIGKLSGIIIKNNLKYSVLQCHSGIALREGYEDFHKLYQLLYNYAKINKINRIIIGSYDQQICHNIIIPRYYITKRTEYIIDLQKQWKISDLSKQLKRNIKKAKKSIGSNFNIHHNIDASYLFKILTETQNQRKLYKRDTFNPLYISPTSKDSTTKIMKSKLAEFYVYKKENAPYCIEFNLIYNKKAYNYLRGADRNAYRNSLPSLLSVKMIQQYKDKGFKSINLGGIPNNKDGELLARYKKGLGAKEVFQYGLTTNFIQYPYKLINPLLNIGRKLKHIPFLYQLKERIL